MEDRIIISEENTNKNTKPYIIYSLVLKRLRYLKFNIYWISFL